MQSTLSSKYQATIPKPVRVFLDLKPGDKFKFFLQPDGAVVILPMIRTASLKGALSRLEKPVSVEQINAALESAAAGRSGL